MRGRGRWGGEGRKGEEGRRGGRKGRRQRKKGEEGEEDEGEEGEEEEGEGKGGESEANLPWPESPDRPWWGPVSSCCETLEALGPQGLQEIMLTALLGLGWATQSRCSGLSLSEREAPRGAEGPEH